MKAVTGSSLQNMSRFDTPRKSIFPSRPKKPAFRPAGVVSLFKKNDRLIEGIKQDLHVQHRNPGVQQRRNPTVKRHRNQKAKRPGYSLPPDRPSKVPSLVMPAIPITALFILVLGLFFHINNQGSLDWLGREVVAVEKDSGSLYNLAVYAGINSGEYPAAESSETMPLDLSEVFAWHSYKVKRGDSVSKIALDFSVSMDAIIASNGITNARSLREGEVLRIPNMDGIPYTVARGDSLFSISQSMGVPLEAILDANDIQSDVISAGTTLFIPGARMNRDDLRLALGELFIYPVKGARLSSPFGWRNDPFTGVRRHHAALDLSAPQGTQIRAAMDGRVTLVSFDRTYGNYIIMTHSGGFQTMYAHLHSFAAKQGDYVSQGALIGTVGSTGYSTGPHLHFAVFKNGRAVNPLDFLNPSR